MTSPSRATDDEAWLLLTPDPEHAKLVAGWSCSAEEATRWASLAEHPFPPSVVSGWFDRSDVTPWLLIDPDGVPVGYGELWDDEEEDEVELARLIVDPQRRGHGIGRVLVERLLGLAKDCGRLDCFLRVVAENVVALELYRASGFRHVRADQAAEWNKGQPVDFVWLQYPLHRSHRNAQDL